MAHNIRFAVGIHIMTLIAWLDGEPAKSDLIARSASTNPVVVRRMLGALAKAGLVTSQPGAAGGSRLTRDAREITLLDIYHAVDEDSIFALHHQSPSASCPIGKGIQPVLTEVFTQASSALGSELGQTTLADLVSATHAPSRQDYLRDQARERTTQPTATHVE
ncbi:MAG: putative Rrf2 family transcriptional regulator [Chloroflexi bacterium]|nr:putative Rrf2 family transcriptional regulator [Chloroflexota bacterium]